MNLRLTRKAFYRFCSRPSKEIMQPADLAARWVTERFVTPRGGAPWALLGRAFGPRASNFPLQIISLPLGADNSALLHSVFPGGGRPLPGEAIAAVDWIGLAGNPGGGV